MQDNGINIRHLLYWVLHRIYVVKMRRLNVYELYACTENEWLGELSRVCACGKYRPKSFSNSCSWRDLIRHETPQTVSIRSWIDKSEMILRPRRVYRVVYTEDPVGPMTRTVDGGGNDVRFSRPSFPKPVQMCEHAKYHAGPNERIIIIVCRRAPSAIAVCSEL